MSLLKFYTDAHIDTQVAMQLRLRGIDVIRCQDVGLTEADDETHLQYAAANGLALVTHDQDFLRLNMQWKQQGQSHNGIFFLQQYLQGNVGQVVIHLMEYARLVEIGAGNLETDIEEHVIYIG
jgi:hypothetical protein